MYIFEIIIKKFLSQKKYKNCNNFDQNNDLEKCNHVYLAIDSSKDYLACNNCGKVIKNTQKNIKRNIFKPKNPFNSF